MCRALQEWEICRKSPVRLLESSAVGAILAERVAKFVFCKAIAELRGERALENFGEALLLDVSERDLSAVVKAAGDNASVVENRHMRIECMARALYYLLFEGFFFVSWIATP